MDHGKKKDNSNEANDKMLQNLQMLLALQGAGAGSQMYDPAMFGAGLWPQMAPLGSAAAVSSAPSTSAAASLNGMDMQQLQLAMQLQSAAAAGFPALPINTSTAAVSSSMSGGNGASSSTSAQAQAAQMAANFQNLGTLSGFPHGMLPVGSNDWIAMHQAMMAQMGANPALAPAANPFFNPFAACGVNQALAGAMPQQQQQKSKKSKDNSASSSASASSGRFGNDSRATPGGKSGHVHPGNSARKSGDIPPSSSSSSPYHHHHHHHQQQQQQKQKQQQQRSSSSNSNSGGLTSQQKMELQAKQQEEALAEFFRSMDQQMLLQHHQQQQHQQQIQQKQQQQQQQKQKQYSSKSKQSSSMSKQQQQQQQELLQQQVLNAAAVCAAAGMPPGGFLPPGMDPLFRNMPMAAFGGGWPFDPKLFNPTGTVSSSSNNSMTNSNSSRAPQQRASPAPRSSGGGKQQKSSRQSTNSSRMSPMHRHSPMLTSPSSSRNGSADHVTMSSARQQQQQRTKQHAEASRNGGKGRGGAGGNGGISAAEMSAINQFLDPNIMSAAYVNEFQRHFEAAFAEQQKQAAAAAANSKPSPSTTNNNKQQQQQSNCNSKRANQSSGTFHAPTWSPAAAPTPPPPPAAKQQPTTTSTSSRRRKQAAPTSLSGSNVVPSNHKPPGSTTTSGGGVKREPPDHQHHQQQIKKSKIGAQQHQDPVLPPGMDAQNAKIFLAFNHILNAQLQQSLEEPLAGSSSGGGNNQKQQQPNSNPIDFDKLLMSCYADMHKTQQQQQQTAGNSSKATDNLAKEMSNLNAMLAGSIAPSNSKPNGIAKDISTKEECKSSDKKNPQMAEKSSEPDEKTLNLPKHQELVSEPADTTKRYLNEEERILEPIKQGWTREIHIEEKQTHDSQGQVIYVTPENIRLKSQQELTEYLNAHAKFNHMNFSFNPELPVGNLHFGDKVIPWEDLRELTKPSKDASKGATESSNDSCTDNSASRHQSSESKPQVSSEKPDPGKQESKNELVKNENQELSAETSHAELQLQQEKMYKQQKLEEQMFYKQLREKQLIEERQRMELARHLKQQEAIKKAKEKEMRRQQMIEIKNMELKRRAEERELKKEQARNFRIHLKERRLEQKRQLLRIAQKNKQTFEDRQLKNITPLPQLKPFQGNLEPENADKTQKELSGNAMADAAMVLEFVHTFKDVISLEDGFIPKFEDFRLGLLNDPRHVDAMVKLTMALLHQGLCDPGVPVPGPWLNCAMGLKVTDIDISPNNYSEILRLYLWARNGEKTEVSKQLETRSFASLDTDVKASTLAFLANELISSRPIVGEIERHLEALATLRREKWMVEGKIRQARIDAINERTDNCSSPSKNNNNKKAKPNEPAATTATCVTASNNNSNPEVNNHNSGENGSVDRQTRLNCATKQKMESLSKEHHSFTDKLFLRAKPLRALDCGLDRYKRRYWVLSQLGAVYVEGLESGIIEEDPEDVADLNSDGEEEEDEPEAATESREESSKEEEEEEKMEEDNEDEERSAENDEEKPEDEMEVDEDAEKKTDEKETVVNGVEKPSEEMEEGKEASSERPKSCSVDREPSNPAEDPASPVARQSDDVISVAKDKTTVDDNDDVSSEHHHSVEDEPSEMEHQDNVEDDTRTKETEAATQNNEKARQQQETAIDLSTSTPQPCTPDSKPSRDEHDVTKQMPPFATDEARDTRTPESSGTTAEMVPFGHQQQQMYGAGNRGCGGNMMMMMPLDLMMSLEEPPEEPLLDKPTKMPKDMKYGWWKIDTEEDLDQIINSLHQKGSRERELHRILTKHRPYVVDSMKVAQLPEFKIKPKKFTRKADNAAGTTTPPSGSLTADGKDERSEEATTSKKKGKKKRRDRDREEGVFEELDATAFNSEMQVLKQVEDLLERCIAVNILNKAWSTVPRASVTRTDFALTSHEDAMRRGETTSSSTAQMPHDERSILGEAVHLVQKLEQAIPRAFLKPPLIRKGGATEFSNLPSLSESGAGDVAAGLRTWRNGVGSASSAAQLSMAVTMLQSCITWEKFSESLATRHHKTDQSPKSASLATAVSSGTASGPTSKKKRAAGDKRSHQHQSKKKKKNSDSTSAEAAAPGTATAPKTSSSAASRMPIENADATNRKNVTASASNKQSSAIPDESSKDSNGFDEAKSSSSSSSRSTPSPLTHSAPNPKSSGGSKKKKKKTKTTAQATSTSAPQTPADAAADPKQKKRRTHTSICRDVLKDLKSHEQSVYFLYPVNLKEIPDYKKIIKKPIDFQTIEKRLRKGRYKSMKSFSSEVRMVFDNCQAYNVDESPIGRAGHAVRQYFEKRWAELEPVGDEAEEEEEEDVAAGEEEEESVKMNRSSEEDPDESERMSGDEKGCDKDEKT